MTRPLRAAALVLAAPLALLQGQATRSQPGRGADVSAAISDLRYEVTFDKSTAASRTIRVQTQFNTASRDPVILSLPAWTPGAYELSNYAKWISSFRATGDGKPLAWDKTDFDTWRVRPEGAKAITITFDYRADSMDNAMAWSSDDFAFFNGTNLFLYPEGRDTEFGASVSVKTEQGWKVATGMPSAGAPLRYATKNFHDLVDMPFFVGHIALDSMTIAGKTVRLASYPAPVLAGEERKLLWDQVAKMFPPMIEVFGENPIDSYTILTLFDSTSQGGSALEHQNSHLGIYTPFIIGNPLLASITAHEIFHLWNVKRMRPADLVPYRYDRAQPTTWLWVSEGITDYYADLALVRGGIVDSTIFLNLVSDKIREVNNVPAVALEDASLSTWIHPTDGTAYIYYPKGSLAGFLIDVMIRDASDNKSSLDDVMRSVYQSTFKQGGRGFTAQDWWSAVSKAAGGKAFAETNAKYIDGRDAFPWSEVLPLAGLRIRTDTIKEPRLGVFTAPDSSGGVRITLLEPGGAAEQAGAKPGDVLVSVGEIPVNDASFGPRFRQRYSRGEGTKIPLVVRRDGREETLSMTVVMSTRTEDHVMFDPGASPKAVRIRRGILSGTN
jgi:predicted metalloprotease with PDZ domain